ncbi:MAG TPA: hypothetical protein VM686_07125 [Polyangiaceae bacterium]|nr:hypothetical protein [Polyangiaceae bacterium]
MAFALPKKSKHAAACAVLLLALRSNAQTQPPPPGPGPAAPAHPSSSERLGDDLELQRVVGLYDVGKYDECAKELDKLLDPKSPRPLQRRQVKETARIYHAACLIGSGQFERSDAPLRDAIRENPQMDLPDALIFPRPVVERFLRVRQSMAEELRKEDLKRLEEAKKAAEEQKLRQEEEQKYLARVEAMAAKETVIDPNSRWIAALPFGVGQFQNGDRSLGYVFLGTEVLALGTGLTALAVATQISAQESEIEAKGGESDAASRAQDWHLVGRIGTWSFIGLAVIGIAEAELSFVPERSYTRSRRLPRRPAPATKANLGAMPDVSLSSDGFSLGISGRF